MNWEPLERARWAATEQGEGADGSRAGPPNLAQRALLMLARNSILRRGVFRATVNRIVFLLGGFRPIDVTFRGASYRLRGGRNLIEYGLLLSPDYNSADIDFLLEAAGEGGVFVDIGCNIGLYTLPIARAVGAKGRCVAIDANPLMAEYLTENARLSGLENIDVFAAAVSDREGSGQLSVRKNDDAIVAVDETADGPITVRTLSSVVGEAGLERIDGLKIDIEGHEDKALVPFLDGAPRALLPKRIVIEHPQPDADYPGCTAAFARHGYVLAGRSRNNSFYRLPDD